MSDTKAGWLQRADSTVINLGGDLELCSLLADTVCGFAEPVSYIGLSVSKYWIRSHREISDGLRTVCVSYANAFRIEHYMFWGSCGQYRALPPAIQLTKLFCLIFQSTPLSTYLLPWRLPRPLWKKRQIRLYIVVSGDWLYMAWSIERACVAWTAVIRCRSAVPLRVDVGGRRRWCRDHIAWVARQTSTLLLAAIRARGGGAARWNYRNT